MSKMVSFRFPEELLERLDGARGEEPRSKFVIAAVEEWLEGLKPIPKPKGEGEGTVVARGEGSLRNEYVPPRSIPCEEVKQMSRKAKEGPPRPDRTPPPVKGVAGAAVLRCPSSGCDFQAPSPNARCPKHGRRVR